MPHDDKGGVYPVCVVLLLVCLSFSELLEPFTTRYMQL